MAKPGPQPKDHTGRRFGRWLIIEFDTSSLPGQPRWICLCDCGGMKSVRWNMLLMGRSRSCGCLRAEISANRRRTHSLTGSLEYRRWQAMKRRCCNPNYQWFKDYGGRGITVCDRWLHSFENFLADMGPCPQGLTLERKDVNMGYSPDNCIWATQMDQANNTRSNHKLTFQGKTQTLAQWGRETGISSLLILTRIKRYGWSVERAITEPAYYGKNLPVLRAMRKTKKAA